MKRNPKPKWDPKTECILFLQLWKTYLGCTKLLFLFIVREMKLLIRNIRINKKVSDFYIALVILLETIATDANFKRLNRFKLRVPWCKFRTHPLYSTQRWTEHLWTESLNKRNRSHWLLLLTRLFLSCCIWKQKTTMRGWDRDNTKIIVSLIKQMNCNKTLLIQRIMYIHLMLFISSNRAAKQQWAWRQWVQSIRLCCKWS